MIPVRAILYMLFALVAPASTAAAQRSDPSRWAGRWTGHGSFFNAELREKVDSLPFALHIEPDRSGTGTVGDATLRDVRVKATGSSVEIRARLTRPVAADPALDKDRLVLVVTAITDTTMRAEFHLKTNFIYDLRMREGHVVLFRSP